MYPGTLRAYQRSQYAGNQRHGRTEPKGYNAHFEREKRKRRKQRQDPEPSTVEEAVRRSLKAANGNAPGHPKTEDERSLADLCGRWALARLDIDPDRVSAKWGPKAADLVDGAWGTFTPSTGTVKVADNHPTLISMIWTILHETVHASDAEKGEIAPAWKRTPDETNRIEAETDERTADLLDEFLAWLDDGKLREAGISGLTFDDIFPHTEPVAA